MYKSGSAGVLCFLCLLACALAGPLPFTFKEIATNLPQLAFSTSAWKDINGDSYPDLVFAGRINGSSSSGSYIMLGSGTGTFTTAPFTSQLEGVDQGSVGWADYNRDGRQDFYLFGSLSTAYVYRGATTTGFAPTYSVLPADQVPPARYQCMANWVDYNGDGYADLFLCGVNWNCFLYRYNTGTGGFTDATPSSIASFTGAASGGSTWADYDKDGIIDLFVTGATESSSLASALFRQNPVGTFTDTGVGIQAVGFGGARFADLNKDTYPDLVTVGSSTFGSTTPSVGVYLNNQAGGFTTLTTALNPAAFASLDVGDFNGDGYPDIVICGVDTMNFGKCYIYRNNQNLTFTAINAGLTGLSWSSTNFVDFNNDGLLDVFISGVDDNSNRITKLYQNMGPKCVNGAPQLLSAGWACGCYAGWIGELCDTLECPVARCIDTGVCVLSIDACVASPTPPQGELPAQPIVNSQVVVNSSVAITVDLLSADDTTSRGQIIIPAGVFGDSVQLTTLLTLQSVPLSTINAADVDINNIFSVVIDLTFIGGNNVSTFVKPINVTLVVNQLPPGACLGYLQGNSWRCEDYNLVELPGGLVYGLTTHFTSFAVVLEPNNGDGDGFDNVLLAPIIVSVVVALFVVVMVSVGIVFFFWWKRRRVTNQIRKSTRAALDAQEDD